MNTSKKAVVKSKSETKIKVGGDLSELSDNHIYVVITLIHGVEGSPLILFKSNTKRIKSFAVKGLFTLDKKRVKLKITFHQYINQDKKAKILKIQRERE